MYLPENNDKESTITQNGDKQNMSRVNASGQGTLQQGQQSMLYRLMTQIIIFSLDIVYNITRSTVVMTGPESKDVSSHYLY